MQLLAIFDRTLTKAPTYSYTSPLVSGVPMYGVLAPFCNTQAGYHAFTNYKVHGMFHKIFNQWTRFLVSPASRDVLVTTEGGWFSSDALQVQANRLGLHFEQEWTCYPDQPHTWGSGHGTTSSSTFQRGCPSHICAGQLRVHQPRHQYTSEGRLLAQGLPYSFEHNPQPRPARIPAGLQNHLPGNGQLAGLSPVT